MHTYTPENSISDGPVTNQPSVLCILIETISRAHAKGEKSLNGFRFGTLVGRFLSDGAGSMAVKGLSVRDEDVKQCIHRPQHLKKHEGRNGIDPRSFC